MKAVVVVPIKGSGNAWRVAHASDPPEQVQDREVTLLIQSDGAKGYLLIMSPTGCFTADSWHDSIADAQETAQELFGVALNAWV